MRRLCFGMMYTAFLAVNESYTPHRRRRTFPCSSAGLVVHVLKEYGVEVPQELDLLATSEQEVSPQAGDKARTAGHPSLYV